MVEGDASTSEAQKDELHDNIATLVEKKYGSRELIPQALVCPLSKVPLA